MRRFRQALFATAAAAFVSFVASFASAHDQWLEAEPFFSSGPGREKIYLFSGDRFADPQPLAVKNRAHYAHFFIQSAPGRRDILGDLREDTQPIALLTSGAATGSFVIALDGVPHTLSLDAKKFGEYLLEERLVDVIVARMEAGTEDAPGRERYSRCLKAIVQIGAKLDPVATQAVGQELEIVPEVHPYRVVPGGQLTVRVLFRGKPLGGRAITAVNRYRGEIQSKTVRVDAAGRATFAIARPGDWMIRLVHMEPSQEKDVDWRSYWSNLTFSLPEPPTTRH